MQILFLHGIRLLTHFFCYFYKCACAGPEPGEGFSHIGRQFLILQNLLAQHFVQIMGDLSGCFHCLLRIRREFHLLPEQPHSGPVGLGQKLPLLLFHEMLILFIDLLCCRRNLYAFERLKTIGCGLIQLRKENLIIRSLRTDHLPVKFGFPNLRHIQLPKFLNTFLRRKKHLVIRNQILSVLPGDLLFCRGNRIRVFPGFGGFLFKSIRFLDIPGILLS